MQKKWYLILGLVAVLAFSTIAISLGNKEIAPGQQNELTPDEDLSSADLYAPAPSCKGKKTLCYGVCVDTSSDEDYCGDCDTQCEPGQVCTKGMCVSTCSRKTCDGTCIATADGSECCPTGSTPCGRKGSQVCCDATESCVDGSCVNSYCSDPAKPQYCTWTVNGVPSEACCDEIDTCALGFGGDASWHDHAVCCPEDQLFGYQCCPEGTHPYTSDAGWTSCERDSCINDVLDPGEGDIDCGGDPDFGTGCYERCVNGQSCVATGDNDCASYYCSEGICEACTEPTDCDYGYTCTDGGVCEYSG